MKEKILIYQVLPRLFGNDSTTNKQNGTISENGVGKFSSFDEKALSEIKKMGISHIWYTGVLEHATKTDYSQFGIPNDHPDVIKGNAGSPYAIKDYYDVCPDFADDVNDRIAEFEALVKRTHDAGMKVIIDFVPNHVARQYKSDAKPAKVKDFGEDDNIKRSFVANNNFYYLPDEKLDIQFVDVHEDGGYNEFPAKVTGNDNFSSKPSINDWYETVKLNYGVDYQSGGEKHFDPIPDTWNKMKDILLYWTDKGVDGFRCDMAEMVPVEFWGWVIPLVKRKNKGILFIAEVYNPNEYSNYVFNGKFDYLYDKVDLYDTIRNVICGHQPTSDITFCWQRVENVQSHMLNFLENHDEQRIASDYFVGNAEKAIPGLHVSTWMNTNPTMIYFGQELGERGMDAEGFSGLDGRTTIFDYWSVDSMVKWGNGGRFDGKALSKEQKALRKHYIAALHIARDEKCIVQGGFYDLMYANYENQHFDSTKQYVFLRFVKDEFLLIVSNFSDEKADVVVDVPMEAFDYMKINPAEMKTAIELLSKKQFDFKKSGLASIPLSIGNNNSLIIKFTK